MKIHYFFLLPLFFIFKFFSLSTQDSLTLQGLIDVRSPMGVHAQNLFALVYGKEEELWAEPLNTGINARKAAEEKIESTVVKSTYLKVYPNPFTGSTQIDVFLEEGVQAVLQLTDISGKIIREDKVTGKVQVLISGDALAPGIYFCHLLQTNTVPISEKLIKIQ